METLTPLKVIDRAPSRRWSQIELLWDSRPGYSWHPRHPSGNIQDPELSRLFVSQAPPPNLIALHDAGRPLRPLDAPPILLVPGATETGHYFLEPCADGRPGLPQFLKAAGRRVFAVTFSHPQDDNFQQAEQLANALDRVKDLTGSPKVDMVAHSKGGIAARILASGLRQPWMRPYEELLRRLVLVGVPNGGVDFFFRYPQFNRTLLSELGEILNWPSPWHQVRNEEGEWESIEERSYGSDYWPGQRQLLGRWDHRFPLPKTGPDWESTYHGGEGEESQSHGLDHYIELGDNLIERLRQTPPCSTLEVALVAGTSPTMPAFLNDTSGPSDGIVFVESALDLPAGALSVMRKKLPLHHRDLVCAEPALEFIAGYLN